MQVSATLIAAQQAAREARSKLQMPAPQAAGQANFASALAKTTGVQDGFSALPLKQTAPTAQSAMPQQAQPGARLGQHVNILV